MNHVCPAHSCQVFAGFFDNTTQPYRKYGRRRAYGVDMQWVCFRAPLRSGAIVGIHIDWNAEHTFHPLPDELAMRKDRAT